MAKITKPDDRGSQTNETKGRGKKQLLIASYNILVCIMMCRFVQLVFIRNHV